MSKPASPPPNDRVRTHIKALLEETKHQAEGAPLPVQSFLSGMLSGLAASVEILDGGTAEGSLEKMAQRLAAAIGQAYLDGKLPPQPPVGWVDASTAVSTPVTTGLTSGIPVPKVRLLACGLCYEENGEEVHPHPECPFGTGDAASRRINIHKQLDRVRSGGVLGASEAELLRQQVEAEMREADTARAVAAGNKRHVQVMYGELEQAQAAIARVRKVTANSFMAGPNAVMVVRVADIRTALDEPVSGETVRQAEAQPTRYAADIRAADETADMVRATGTLREQIARALYETLDRAARNPWDGLSSFLRAVHYQRADAVLVVILPATRITAELARMSEANVSRVIDLYERWVKAGGPPIGTSLGRWWDTRLLELCTAINGPGPKRPS